MPSHSSTKNQWPFRQSTSDHPTVIDALEAVDCHPEELRGEDFVFEAQILISAARRLGIVKLQCFE